MVHKPYRGKQRRGVRKLAVIAGALAGVGLVLKHRSVMRKCVEQVRNAEHFGMDMLQFPALAITYQHDYLRQTYMDAAQQQCITVALDEDESIMLELLRETHP